MRPPGTPEELERRRHRAVALLAERHSLVEVAHMISVDRRSVRRWKAAHRQQGIQALRARRASGRPPKLAPRFVPQVERVLLKGANAAGFATDVWTCPRIAQVMARRFGVRYHVDHLSRRLRALGWSPQKPPRQAVEWDARAIRGWIKEPGPRGKNKRRA